MRDNMKYRSTWDKYIYALLINVYLDIHEDSSRRVLILRDFNKKLQEIGFNAFSIDINQKLGKLEFLMTQGERGTPGVPFPDMQEMVSIYEKDKKLFQLYVEAAYKNTTVELLQAKKEREKAISLEEGTPRYQAAIEGYRVNASVDSLLFSNSIVRVLLDHQVHSVREFADCTEDELSQMKHIGPKRLADMLAVLSILKNEKARLAAVALSVQQETADMLQVKDVAEKAKKLLVAGIGLETPICDLPISVRAKNVLQNQKIETLEQLEMVTFVSFEKVHACGDKTQEEIKSLYGALYLLSSGKTLKEIVKCNEPNTTPMSSEGKKEIVEDIEEQAQTLLTKGVRLETPIWDLPISIRSRNVLHRQKIETLKQLKTVDIASWENVYQCGSKTQKEIKVLYSALSLLLSGEIQEEIIPCDESKLSEGKQETAEDIEKKAKALIAKRIGLDTPIRNLPISGRLQNILLREKIETLKQLETVDIASWENVCQCGRKTQEEIRILYSALALLSSGENLEEIITLDEYKTIPTLSEFIDGLEKEPYRLAIHYRLAGETFGEIGIRLGVTRERIRQMVTKVLSKRPKLQEDAFIPVWDTYRALNDADYGFLFGLSKEVLNYFRMVSKSHTGAENQIRFDCLRQIIHDYAGNEEIVSKAKKLLKESKVFVLIDGEKIEKNRPALIRYAVRAYCQNELSLEEFLAKYNELLKSLSLDTDSKYMVQNNNGIATRLANASCVLWGQWKKLRYYDISAIDSKVFIEEIGLLNYKDVEISAQKFLNDYPDVMKEYDIRNAYEMHNLLKKIWDMDHLNKYLDEHHQVVFRRMPIISIGHANRKRQVMELIQNHSPIKIHDLANLYEEFYGVNTLTVSSNFLNDNDFDQYLNQDTYSIHWTPLPDAVRYQMKKVLTADFYFLEEVYDIFKQEFPNENVWLLNPFTLKEIGFLSYTNYIVRNTYNSAVDYFRHILRQPEADLRDRAYLLTINTFYSQVMKARSEFKIVEVEPLVYDSMEYLQEKGITKEQFYEFWHFIENHVVDNEFFTIFSLKKAGLSLPWQEQYFRNWFYSSVLLEDKEHFRYQRYGECRLFRKSKEMFNLKDFLRFVVSRLDKEMEFHEFTRYLQENYGFCPQESRLKEAIEAEYDLSEKIAIY